MKSIFFALLMTLAISEQALALNVPGNGTEVEIRSFTDNFSTTDRRPLLAKINVTKTAGYVSTNVWFFARIRCTDNSTAVVYESNPLERWLPGNAGYSSYQDSLSWVFNVADPRPDISAPGTAASYTCKFFVKAQPYTGATANTVFTVNTGSGLQMLANTAGSVHGDGGAGTYTNSCTGSFIWYRLGGTNPYSVVLWDIAGDPQNSQSFFTPDASARSVAISSNVTMRACPGEPTVNATTSLLVYYQDGSGNACYDSVGTIYPTVYTPVNYALTLGTHTNPGTYPNLGALSNRLSDEAFWEPYGHSVPVVTCYSSGGTNLGIANMKAKVWVIVSSGQDAEILNFNFSGINFYNEF